MKRRQVMLVLSDDQADTFDALRFLDGPDAFAGPLATVLAAADCDPEVVAAKNIRRRQRAGLRVVEDHG